MADSDVIRHALTVAKSHGFTEVELEKVDTIFHARLSSGPRVVGAARHDPPAELTLSNVPKAGEIVATLVGYYQAAEPPLAVGQTVEKGDVVAVIAALGLANDVESPVSGEVIAVLIEPGQSVEYGQVIAEVRQAS